MLNTAAICRALAVSEPTVRDAAERAVAVIGTGVRSGRERLWGGDEAVVLGTLATLRVRGVAADWSGAALAQAVHDAVTGRAEPVALIFHSDPIGTVRQLEIWPDRQSADAAARRHADARVVALAPVAAAVRSRLSGARNGGSVRPPTSPPVVIRPDPPLVRRAEGVADA